jgi:HSP20 family protein
MKLVRWQPTSTWSQLHDEFDRMVEKVFGSELAPRANSGNEIAALGFPIDVVDRGEHVEVKAELPGIDAEDVKLTCEQGLLVISGEKRHEEKSEKDNFYRFECRYGSFRRAVQIPFEVNADKAEASFKNGVLMVKLPKVEAAKPREVKIKLK